MDTTNVAGNGASEPVGGAGALGSSSGSTGGSSSGGGTAGGTAGGGNDDNGAGNGGGVNPNSVPPKPSKSTRRVKPPLRSVRSSPLTCALHALHIKTLFIYCFGASSSFLSPYVVHFWDR